MAKMTKAEYLGKMKALYQVGNMGDSDNPNRPDWITTAMTGDAGCAALDQMMRGMINSGAINQDDFDQFYSEV